MAGHSKWSKVKHQKAVTDVRKGKIYTKFLKEIQVAAKTGGSNPEFNPRLRRVVDDARAASVPTDNIERAIKKGAGELEGVNYEEVVYEGYGPGGVAMLVKSLTDNRHRTAADIRHAFSRGNGNLASSNAVSYLFSEKGILSVSKAAVTEESVFEVALEAGAEDVKDGGDTWDVITAPKDFDLVKAALQKLSNEIEGGIRDLPSTTVKLTGQDAKNLLELLDLLDDLDDVQSVSANFEIDDSELIN